MKRIRSGILSTVLVFLLGQQAQAGWLTSDPYGLTVTTEFERSLATGRSNLLNFYIIPRAMYGDKKQHVTKLYFYLTQDLSSGGEFYVQDTMLEHVEKNLYKLGNQPFNWTNRIYFPTSYAAQQSSLYYSWRTFTTTTFELGGPELTFTPQARMQWFLHKYATRSPIAVAARSTTEEILAAVAANSLNNLVRFRLGGVLAFKPVERLTLSYEAAMNLTRTYSPGTVDAAAGKKSDWYGTPFLAETISIGLTDNASLDVYLWHEGRLFSGTVNPYSKDGTTFFTALNIDV